DPWGIVASRVWWESKPVSITANQALAAEAAGQDQRCATEAAEEFLREALAGGAGFAEGIKARCGGCRALLGDCASGKGPGPAQSAEAIRGEKRCWPVGLVAARCSGCSKILTA